jgi:hypothetical protein
MYYVYGKQKNRKNESKKIETTLRSSKDYNSELLKQTLNKSTRMWSVQTSEALLTVYLNYKLKSLNRVGKYLGIGD